MNKPISWGNLEIINRIVSAPEGKMWWIKKSKMVHPIFDGFRKSVGWPMGENSNWRLQLRDGSCIHVREYDGHYTAHLDKVDPDVNLIDHLRKDFPVGYIGVFSLAGAMLGWITKDADRAYEWGLGGVGIALVTL